MFLLFLCGCLGFMSGYGVREMISQRRRREVRKIRDEAERLLEMRANRRTQSDILGAELAKLPKAKGTREQLGGAEQGKRGRGKKGLSGGSIMVPPDNDIATLKQFGVTNK
jgi:hypothetical protein